MKLKLDYITKKQLIKMINNLSPNQMDYFKDFYKIIKNKKITPALIQKYLFYCYQKNKTIIEEIDYFKSLLEEKKEAPNHFYV